MQIAGIRVIAEPQVEVIPGIRAMWFRKHHSKIRHWDTAEEWAFRALGVNLNSRTKAYTGEIEPLGLIEVEFHLLEAIGPRRESSIDDLAECLWVDKRFLEYQPTPLQEPPLSPAC